MPGHVHIHKQQLLHSIQTLVLLPYQSFEWRWMRWVVSEDQVEEVKIMSAKAPLFQILL